MTCFIFILSSVFLLSSAAGNICGPNASPKDGIDCSSDCCPEADGQATACPDPCATSCKCDIMYHRAYNGTCIRSRDCPSIPCGENEEFDSCPTCSESCDNARPDGRRCPIIGRIGTVVICDPKCRCKDNYWRNKHNKCVPYDQCRCNENERETSCVNSDCITGCICIENYLRAKDGTCIKKDQCPKNTISSSSAFAAATAHSSKSSSHASASAHASSYSSSETEEGDDSSENKDDRFRIKQPTCKKNEIYDICPAPCPPKRCDVDESVIKCKAPPKPGDPDCKPGCRCIDNYYKNDKNVCVPKNECLICNGQNEVPGCDSCSPQTCESIGKTYNCPLEPAVCKPTCRCKKGFYRNKIGQCISKTDCLKCTGPNEYFSCGSACDNECSDLSKNQTSCPIINVKCNEKCYCEAGYARNNRNICIPIEKCPPPKVTCGPDEVFSSCVNGGCGRWNCSQTDIICKNLIEGACREGCHCKNTHLRANNGTCIPADQCPLICNGQNEVPGCDSCSPQTCESIGKTYNCPLEPAVCKPTCRCKKGFYRNKIGQCISKTDCLKCTGPNEYFSCGSACDNECSDLSKNQTSCPIINVKCNEKCYCEAGYARNNRNICIPIEKCPPKIKPTKPVNCSPESTIDTPVNKK
ncbi:unnamed protein product, partial [Brenthis ino]